MTRRLILLSMALLGVVESASAQGSGDQSYQGLFIYDGENFPVVGALIENIEGFNFQRCDGTSEYVPEDKLRPTHRTCEPGKLARGIVEDMTSGRLTVRIDGGVMIEAPPNIELADFSVGQRVVVAIIDGRTTVSRVDVDQATEIAEQRGGSAPEMFQDLAVDPEALELAPQNQTAGVDDQGDSTAEQTDVAATDEQGAAMGEGMAMTGSGYEPVLQDLSVAKLIGAPVLDWDAENIGEVDDVVFDPDGLIEAVVVDVGGFLGMGEKQVALQFDTLQVQEDEDGDLQLMVNATQEQLEAAPAYIPPQ